MEPHLYADFQNVDSDGRIRLNTAGTLEDISRLQFSLSDGLSVTLDADDGDSDRGLTIPAIIELNPSEGIWSATVDWSQLNRVIQEPTLELAVPLRSR